MDLRHIAPEAPALAGALAVLGDGHPLERVSALAELDPGRAAEVARELVLIGVLASEDPAAFADPLVRQAVYDDLSAARRASMHATVAEQLAESDALAAAEHLRNLGPGDLTDEAARRLRSASSS